jgi:hypothetical protein
MEFFYLTVDWFTDRGGAAWQPMGVTGVAGVNHDHAVGVNDLSITDLSEGARTPSR